MDDQRFLEQEVWPLIPAEARGKPITKEEVEAILGFGPDGVRPSYEVMSLRAKRRAATAKKMTP